MSAQAITNPVDQAVFQAQTKLMGTFAEIDAIADEFAAHECHLKPKVMAFEILVLRRRVAALEARNG